MLTVQQKAQYDVDRATKSTVRDLACGVKVISQCTAAFSENLSRSNCSWCSHCTHLLLVLTLKHTKAIILSGAEDREVDKRYLAALAKNGRLPKFANAEKKNQPQEGSPQSSEKDDTDEDYSKDIFLEDKRHLGNFLRVHGKPKFMPSNSYGDSNRDEKRNIASMARLGRLNSVRFARLHPYNVGGKRMSSEETSNNDEDNAISIFEDPDCIETDEVVENAGEDRPIWMQSKRYVAALARSGRLPIWHSQRMWWGSKRDDSRPSWSSSRLEDNRADNDLNEIPFVAAKNKRCKKAYDSQAGKRNIASLARGGKLPYRPTL